MMKKYLVVFIILSSFTVLAQQEIQFSQFMFNRTFYNPGHTGLGGAICVTAFHRTQWAGFENAPETQSITLDAPVRFLGGGLGVNFFRDQIGFFDDINFSLSYAYHLQLGDGVLGIGVRGDLLNKALLQPEWITPSGQPATNDQGIARPGANGLAFDAAFGVHYKTERFNVGVSSIRMIEAETELENGANGVTQFRGKRTFLANADYRFDIENTDIAIIPGIFVKYDVAKTQADLNILAMFDNRFWGGLSYRFTDAIAIMAGAQIAESLALGYSYDITTSGLSGVSNGSHEVFLRYCFKIEIPPREIGKYRNVRFL